jgi:phytoene synthase
LPRQIRGSELAEIAGGWVTWSDRRAPQAGAFFPEVGAHLFRLGARLLTGERSYELAMDRAGRIFASAHEGRRGLLEIRPTSGIAVGPVPRRLRPLTALAALAARDLTRGGPPFEPEASPGRALALLLHRLTGRFPR